METKICIICRSKKTLNDFGSRKNAKDGHRNECKECRKNQMNKYYKENKEILNEKSRIYREKNKESLLEKQRTNYEKNRESIKKYDRIRYRKNIEKRKERSKKYYQKNKKEILIKVKRYYEKYHEDNKEKVKEQRKKYYEKYKEKKLLYVRNRKETDPVFSLSRSIRNIVYRSLKINGYKKTSRTYEILGCTFEEFKNHIELQFKEWMTWENYGKYNGTYNFGWDIDHIIPISIAKTEEDVIKLNHYTNLQPLCSKINRYIKKEKYATIPLISTY